MNELLKQCKTAQMHENYQEILDLTGEILKTNPKNQTAIGYRSFAYLKLKQYDEALNLLDNGCRLYPDNYYLKNNLAMLYYDLGEYEKSLKCCEEGLKINDFDWLHENKIKALLKLNRIDEAMDCYENGPWDIEITDLLIETGKYSEALKYCLEEDLEDYESIIDQIKEKNTGEVGDYYISWIYKIKSKSNIRFCPDCGGELIPIVWGLPHEGLLRKAERGEIFLGGCCIPPNHPNYHCKKCDGEFDLGVEGLHIECDDYRLYEYIEYKIKELISLLRGESLVVIRSLDTLKKELKGFDDEEFNAFIKHLIGLDCLCVPREGYIKLVGYDDFRCAKEYPDDDKFAAPRWLVYPQLSAWTIGWRMGAGENYAMNMPYYGEEFEKLFPKPRYWEFYLSESPYKPIPPL